jgi:ubiquinone biosynthesis protein UbiJ
VAKSPRPRRAPIAHAPEPRSAYRASDLDWIMARVVELGRQVDELTARLTALERRVEWLEK